MVIILLDIAFDSNRCQPT